MLTKVPTGGAHEENIFIGHFNSHGEFGGFRPNPATKSFAMETRAGETIKSPAKREPGIGFVPLAA